MNDRSPFRQRHDRATRFGRLATGTSFKKDLLRGRRYMRRPLMALMTELNMGPVRHALAQRTIAGTMEVHTGGPIPHPGRQPAPEAETE